MAYIINLTNGTPLTTVADGTINATACSMTLVGKNYAGYGEFLDENFVHLLENSADSTAPSTPLAGQLWFDSGSLVIKVWNGSTWKSISSAAAQPTPPTGNTTGDIWFDTSTNQLKVWTGSAWLVVGPAYSSTQGLTGAIPLVITDVGSVDHLVTALYTANTLVSIVSDSTDFVPQAPYATQFPVIYKGTTVYSDGAMSGNIKASGNVYVTSNGTTTVTVSDSGLYVNGSVTVGSTGQDTLQVGNVTNGNGNGVGNIGSPTTYFNTVHATATTALYADVAERFAADDVYEAGTVVELGGVAEITKSLEDLSDNVFGVISTRAAYLMNGGAGTNETHPPVAMTGRVPVQVVGKVNKGDRLVSAGNGMARAALPGEATAFNIIGRALASKITTDTGLVEAIVTIK